MAVTLRLTIICTVHKNDTVLQVKSHQEFLEVLMTKANISVFNYELNLLTMTFTVSFTHSAILGDA